MRLDTFKKSNEKKVFYFGTNDTRTITDIRKTILTQFKELPEMTEYMHYSSFDGADKYGKDTFMFIKYLGKSTIPALFRLKRLVEMIVSLIPLVPNNFFDIFLQIIFKFFPDHLPNRLREYRSKYDHYLILVATDSVISEIRKLLLTFVIKQIQVTFLNVMILREMMYYFIGM